MKPSRDEIIRDLIEFFIDELKEDAAGVGDWLVQGDWDTDEFINGVYELKSDLSLA